MSDEAVSFDIARFQKTQFRPREETVRVKDLAPFFGTNGTPADPAQAVWKVRGLTAEELARVNEAGESAKKLDRMAEALTSLGRDDNIEGLKQWLGISKDVPSEHCRRLEMLILGSIEPKVDRQFAVKLADAFPIEFLQITNTITALTSRGKQWGEPSDSGPTPVSESP